MPARIFAETGVRYGRLVVVDPEGPRMYADPIKNRAGMRTAIVACDCGSAPRPVPLTNLVRGNTRSCGCLRREVTGQRSHERAVAYAQSRNAYVAGLEAENAQLRAQLRAMVQGSYGRGAD